jgi:molecular chaperone GrpE
MSGGTDHGEVEAAPGVAPADGGTGAGRVLADGEPAGAAEGAAPADAAVRAEEYLQALQRLKADFDNYRRRTAQDQARWGEAAVAAFVARILPVVDNLERAVQAGGDAAAVRQGVELTLRQLREVLAAAGVVPLEALGQPFDPERHEAVARGPAAGMAEGTVAEEYRRGYLMRGSVLRPALVKVVTAADGSGGPAAGAGAAERGSAEEGEH